MSVSRTYLDHNASSPLRPEARAAMVAALDVVGNPSSVHAEGRRARAIIEAAREQVAALVGAQPKNVVFTSGGTEAVNTIVAGGHDCIAVAGIEHECVRRAADASRALIEDVPVDLDGVIAPKEIARILAESSGMALVCIQAANNETGVRQDLTTLAEVAHATDALVFSDAVQAAGKVAIDMTGPGPDVIALSAHKLGGPKGVGAIVLREGIALERLLHGGGQEQGRRAGTENVAGIAGFGAAAKAALDEVGCSTGLAQMRDRVVEGVRALTPHVCLIGEGAARLPNTALVAWPQAKAETLVMALDLEGIAVSAGAACSSGKVGRSATLEAMGLAPSIRDSAIRVSLGWSTTEEDIERFLAAWARVSERLEKRRVA
ncbi:MAG: cysteine desulfurase family protein [Hyphomicrobiaceae bacterium]